MIEFKERFTLSKTYDNWMKDKLEMEPTSHSVILWLQTHGMLNEDKVKKIYKQ